MLAVRPPEYWPRLDYFALMDAADTFVLADTFQYSRQSFHNRTRVRNPDGWQWLSIRLEGGQHGAPIAQTRIAEAPHWARKHWRALVYNYRTTPFFPFYEPELKPLFYREWTHLGALTCDTVRVVHRLLGLRTLLVQATEMPTRPATLRDVVAACAEEVLLVPEAVARRDGGAAAHTRVLAYQPPVYQQNFEGFAPGMSVLDLLFNYGPEALPRLREGRRIVTAPQVPGT